MKFFDFIAISAYKFRFLENRGLKGGAEHTVSKFLITVLLSILFFDVWQMDMVKEFLYDLCGTILGRKVGSNLSGQIDQ